MNLHDKSGHATPLVFGRDYLVGGDPLAATQDVDAPLVITPKGLLLVGSDDGKLYAVGRN